MWTLCRFVHLQRPLRAGLPLLARTTTRLPPSPFTFSTFCGRKLNRDFGFNFTFTKLFSPPAELGRPPPAGRQSPKGGPVSPPGDTKIKITVFSEVKTTVRCDNYQDNYMWDTSRNRKGPIFMDQPPEEPEVQPGSEMRSTFSFYLNWQLLQSIVMRFNKIPVQNILLNVISSSCWQIT